MEKKESWFARNWFGIVSEGSKWGARTAALFFFGSLILYWAWGGRNLARYQNCGCSLVWVTNVRRIKGLEIIPYTPQIP